MSPEFGELLLEVLVLYGKHEDSDIQAAFLDRTVVSSAHRLSAIRAVQTCKEEVRVSNLALTTVVGLINKATIAYAEECKKAGFAVSRDTTDQVRAGLRAASLDAALGGDSSLATQYEAANAASASAKRKVRGNRDMHVNSESLLMCYASANVFPS